MTDPQPDFVIPEPALLLAALADCLCESIALTVGGPVCWCGIWHGEDVPTDVCDSCDGDHCGMAWARIISSFASDTFPEPTLDQTCTKPLAYQIEVGVARCWPTPEDGAFPEPDEVAAATVAILDDHDAMRRALLCCGGDWEIWLDVYEPFNSGGCAGGTWSAFATAR